MKIKKTYLNKTKAVSIFMVLIFLVTMVIPLGGMFLHLDAESIEKVFSNESLLTVTGNSILSAFLTTVISLILAYILAWCVERTKMPHKKTVRFFATVPMLIPSVSIGMGAILVGGNNGFLTNIFGIEGGKVYGLLGIVWGSVMYSLPVAFLMISNILRYEDSAPYEAATVLGIPPIHRFFSITFPYLRKPMISAAFAIFTLSFTDYGVPLMVGGKFKTLPMVMYQEVIGQLDFGKGCVYGAIMLIPAIIAFVLDFMNSDKGNSAFVIKPFILVKNKVKDSAAFLVSALITTVSLLPIISFITLAFVKKYPSDLTFSLEHFVKTFYANGAQYLFNSVVISLSVAFFGTAIGIACAYFTARLKGKTAKYLHLMAMSTAAVPGIVLGLSYVLFFKGSFIYDTLLILVMVNIVHFFSSPYLMMYTSFSKVNENLEAVASTLGIGKAKLLFDIILEGCKDTVKEMFSYFFVNSMMTISAVSFLAGTRTKPIALMINQFEAQSQLEAAAAVSFMILAVNIAVKMVGEKNKGAT